MSNDPRGSSYDLGGAGAIAGRLTKRAPKPRAASNEPSGFVRFSLDRLRMGAPVAAASEPAEATEPVPWSPEMMGSPGWAKLLDWCIDAYDADAAFVVDARGLLVGSRGLLPQEEIDEIGARLLIAFEQADHMSPGGSQSMSIERDKTWLLGLRVALNETERLTVGVVTPRPISAAARKQVEEAFTRKARDF